jgi:DNA polymerase (family X)
MTKPAIAHILKEIGFFLRLKGENPYKARAYERAGESLLMCDEPLHSLVQKEMLTRVTGIGAVTAAVITELWQTGVSTLHQSAKGAYPSSLVELGEVPGLTTKQIRRLYDRAGIRSVSDLHDACRTNRLLTVKGFGPRIQTKLLTSLEEFQRGQGYRLFANVLEEVDKLESHLKALPGVQTVTAAGALRRKMEIINQYVFVLCCEGESGTAQVMDRICHIPNVREVAVHANVVTARAPTGLPIHMTVAPSEDYGVQVLRATGSEAHLEEVLRRFAEQGYTTWEQVSAHLKGADEEAVYHAIGLPLVPPELREGRAELEAIRGTEAVTLIEGAQIQGFFHCHTEYSDGADTVVDMVRAARDRGYHYLGISDHSQSAVYANGLKEPRIRRQWAEIDTVQKQYPDLHIFKGIEADILPDGSMDYSDSFLAEFDFVIASVHSRFNLPEGEQTRRVCRALAHPFVTMLGHPTGRLLLSRPGYRIDLEQVMDTAARHHKPLEINGSRYRLDLDWRMVRLAKDRGVTFCINPDAHASEELKNLAFGLNVARKGGLQARDVINTQSLPKITGWLSNVRGRA